MESVTEILSTESSLTSFAGRRGAGGNGDGQDSLLCSLSTAGEGRELSAGEWEMVPVQFKK